MPIWLQTGVYKITNKANGKSYVGSTTLTFKTRWRGHQIGLIRGDHGNIYLQRAWNKYGEENFQFEVLERCLPDRCIEREQYWLDALDSCNHNVGYNICPIAESRRGAKLSEETKRQMSVAHTGVPKGPCSEWTKQKVAESNRRRRGTPMREETKAKISATQVGRKGKIPSLETRRKMSESQKKGWVKRRRVAHFTR